ncbi:DMT family transporter [Rhodoligotrophos defluvii]|uniref:DMT family transporter n=1 Tax=Rhodoligotrophos defluvii TaxID=2561934 RepID=UPI0014853ADD|nr:DMT family transporter [Rhodoligotrophos defluvii]
MDRSRLGVAVAFVSALALAINDVSVPFSYERGFSAPTVVLIRFIALVAVLAILLPLLNHPLRLPRKAVAHAFGSGLCLSVGTLGLLGAFAFIPVSLAVVIIFVFPFLTAVMECVYQRRRPAPFELLCPLAALVGIGMAIGFEPQDLDPRGILLALISAVGFGGSVFWNSVALRDFDGVTVTLYIACAAVLAVGAFLFATGSFRIASLSLNGWLPVFVTCVFYVIATVCMYKAIELAGGPTSAMVFNLEPIFVVVLAAAFLDEGWTWSRALGSMVVVSAIVVAEWWRSRAVRKLALS